MRRVVLQVVMLFSAIALIQGCSAINLDLPTQISSTPGVIPAEVGCSWTISAGASAVAATPASSPVPLSAPVHRITDAVPLGNLTITVQRVSCPPGIGETQPSAGNQFVVVDFTIANTGQETENVSATFESRLRDATGREYGVDQMAMQLGGNNPISGQIQPGESQEGAVGFQVPRQVAGLVFIFDSHPFRNTGRIYVAIQ